MFGLFKKKKAVEVVPRKLEERTQKLVFHSQDFDIGVSEIEVRFESGAKIKTKIRGRVSQSYDKGCDEHHGAYQIYPMREPEPGNMCIIKSETEAKTFIEQINSDRIRTIVDDPENVTKSVSGKIVSAKLVRSTSCITSYDVGAVVPK